MSPLAEQLVDEFLPLTERTARAISRDDEALSAAYLALCLASERWKPGCGVAAKSFVMGRVRQAAKRAVLHRAVTNWDMGDVPLNVEDGGDLPLPERLEGIARMYWVDGFTRDEIARELSLPIHRVRERLAEVEEIIRENAQEKALCPGVVNGGNCHVR